MSISLVACGSQPLPAQSPLPSLDAAAMQAARQFRASFGLRMDDAWIRSVSADPSASLKYGIPLTADELAGLERRAFVASAVLDVINAYGQKHPAEWAGAYIDPQRGVVIARFTAGIEDHQRAISGLLHPDAPIEIVPARWTLAELQNLADRITGSLDSLPKFNAAFRGVGPHIDENLVVLRVSSADPVISIRLVELFKAQGELRVESDGTGVMLLPPGRLLVTAVDGRGKPVPNLDCEVVADVPGAYEGDIGWSTTSKGQCDIPVRASGYTVHLKAHIGTELVEVGKGHVVVPGHGTGALRIVVVTR